MELKATLPQSMADDTATLLISLPSKTTDAVSFDKPFYKANYTIIDQDPENYNFISELIVISDADADISVSDGWYKVINLTIIRFQSECNPFKHIFLNYRLQFLF